MSKDKKRITPYPLRLAPELRERLNKSSKENSRSLHAEILHILSNHFDAEQVIIEAIENDDPKVTNILNSKIAELIDDMLEKKKIISLEQS